MTGEKLFSIQVANIDIIYWPVCSSRQGVSLYKPATSFTLLEYLITWCKIQVVIYLFGFRPVKTFLGFPHKMSAIQFYQKIFMFKCLYMYICQHTYDIQLITVEFTSRRTIVTKIHPLYFCQLQERQRPGWLTQYLQVIFQNAIINYLSFLSKGYFSKCHFLKVFWNQDNNFPRKRGQWVVYSIVPKVLLKIFLIHWLNNFGDLIDLLS